MVNCEMYCHQLDKMKDSLAQDRPDLISRKDIVFQQVNDRPHKSSVSRQTIFPLEQDVLLHLQYSPSPDFLIIICYSPQNLFLNSKNFSSNEDVKNGLVSKDQKFYEH